MNSSPFGPTRLKPTDEIAGELFRKRVARARAMSPSERVLAGIELFDLACRVTSDGIRHQFPDADESRVLDILRERLALARRLERTEWR